MPSKDDVKKPGASAAKTPASRPATASPATLPTAKAGQFLTPTNAKRAQAKPVPVKPAPVAVKAPARPTPVTPRETPAPAAAPTQSAAKIAMPPAVLKPETAPAPAAPAPLAKPMAATPVAAREADAEPVAAKPERKSAEAPKTEGGQSILAKADEPSRQLAVVGLNDARDAFAAVKTSSDRLTRGVEASAQAGTLGMRLFGSSLLSAFQANTDAAFDYVKAMASVKSLSEAVELQSRHAREQFETVTAQVKELTGIANRAAAEAAEPLRKALDEALRKAS